MIAIFGIILTIIGCLAILMIFSLMWLKFDLTEDEYNDHWMVKLFTKIYYFLWKKFNK
jgi:hypothetical protein